MFIGVNGVLVKIYLHIKFIGCNFVESKGQPLGAGLTRLYDYHPYCFLYIYLPIMSKTLCKHCLNICKNFIPACKKYKTETMNDLNDLKRKMDKEAIDKLNYLNFGIEKKT